jgi:hypothetical protein
MQPNSNVYLAEDDFSWCSEWSDSRDAHWRDLVDRLAEWFHARL